MCSFEDNNLSPRTEADGATAGADPIGICEGSKNEVGKAIISVVAEPIFFAVELFCGSGSISKAFSNQGFITWSTDIRRRKNICEPTLKIDFNNLYRSFIPFDNIDVIYAGLPCTAFSYASGNYYYKNQIPTPNAEEYIKLLDKCLVLIHDIKPNLWFIENPRGRLRYNKLMIDFLANNGGCCKYCTLSSYGFPTTKPTDIFTNAYDWSPRVPRSYGRGYKNESSYVFDNLTVCSRQKTPIEFANSIAQYCKHKLSNS